MLLHSRNSKRDIWLAVLAVVMLLPLATANAAVQETAPEENTGAVGQTEKAASTEPAAAPTRLAKVMDKVLDPEGLAGTPGALTPPPILSEQNKFRPEKKQQEAKAAPASKEATGQVETQQAETTPADSGQFSSFNGFLPQPLYPRTARNPAATTPAPSEVKQEEVWQSGHGAAITISEPAAFQTMNASSSTITTGINSSYESTYQTPQLRMTTLGPQQANIHRASQFRFRITNDGPIIAEGVNLAVDISGSGRVISTFPEGGVQQAQAIYFPVGDLAVGAVKEFGFEFQADRAGEVKVTPRLTSSATSEFTAAISAPKVNISILGADTFVVGQRVSQKVVITNEGTETVRNIVVQQACTPSNAFDRASIQPGQNIIDSILPGQTHTIDVSAIAVQTGRATMKIVVEGENVRGTAGKELSFLQSQLSAKIEGPELTYLNSMGTYSITVTNDQTQDIDNVNIRLSLPIGMVVKVVDRKAEFDAASSSIAWNVDKLKAGESEIIPFKATLSQFGQHMVKISVSNSAGAMTHAQMNTQAIGRADIDLKVVTNPEPIETGSTTSVMVQVQNRGTQPAEDVSVVVQLPEAVDGIQSADYSMMNRVVTFDKFRLAPGQIHNLTIPLTGTVSGDHIIRATVESSASTKTISAENSLFFFSNSTMTRTANTLEGNGR